MPLKNYINRTRNFFNRAGKKIGGIRNQIVQNAPLINEIANLGLKALRKDGSGKRMDFDILKPLQSLEPIIKTIKTQTL